MPFINQTGTIGLIMTAGTTDITGNIVATMFIVMIFLLVMCMMFGIPFEFTAVVLLPMCIAMGAYYSNFLGPLIFVLAYVSMVIAKNWIFR